MVHSPYPSDRKVHYWHQNSHEPAAPYKCHPVQFTAETGGLHALITLLRADARDAPMPRAHFVN
jgi:hypothetical protein